MKTKIALLFGLFITLAACNKDQQLISEIAGEYKIESIINYNKGQSSAVSFVTGIIFLEDCTMKNGVGGNCTGWYQIDGKAKVTFQYYTRKENGLKTIKITNLSSFDEPAVMGYYEFKRDEEIMLLNGIKGSDTALNGVSYSEYSDIKLTTK